MTGTAAQPEPRAFSVHSADEAPGRAHIVEGVSFEDAALQFLTEWRVDDDEASLMVEDHESGERRCFRIDLGTGRPAPCD